MAAKNLHNLADNSAYKKWAITRDVALEQLHLNAQLRATDEMRRVLTDVLVSAKASYPDLRNHGHASAADDFERRVKSLLRHAGDNLYRIYDQMKDRVHLLSMTSEFEILSQLDQSRKLSNEFNFQKLYRTKGERAHGDGEQYHRIQMYMDRLARNIVNRAHGSAMNAKTVEQFLEDVLMAFPKRKVFKRVPRILKPQAITEADKKPKADAAIDMIDQQLWQDMLDDYHNDYVPKWRAPEYVIDIKITDPTITKGGEEVWYAWEFERDLTHEFVKSVTRGEIEAANAIGINDFVVIAIIDGDTCTKCCGDFGCRDFDGMLVSEVEKLTGGEYSVSPYHFNCRCRIAPAMENIPDKPEPDHSEFSDWLAA